MPENKNPVAARVQEVRGEAREHRRLHAIHAAKVAAKGRKNEQRRNAPIERSHVGNCLRKHGGVDARRLKEPLGQADRGHQNEPQREAKV